MLTEDDDMLTDGDEDLRALNRDAEKEQMKMDPLGYKIRVWVYYDDRWKKRFGEEADTRADAVMALVDEMYSEETLQVRVGIAGVVECRMDIGQEGPYDVAAMSPLMAT